MSHTTLEEQQSFLNLLNRSCQQRQLYLKSLKLFNQSNNRNNGNAFLSPLVTSADPNGSGANPQFLTADLDMRRKAEILQYNGSSTQGGRNQTRAQYFAQLNRKGSSRYADFSNYITSIRTCVNNKDNIPTSTSSSNVPGPPMNIIYNPSIPLYNYLGMQQNMQQVSVPALINPPFLSQIVASSQSVIQYKSLYTIPVNSTPSTSDSPTVSPSLYLAALTFYTLPAEAILSCSANFQINAVFNFDMINVGGKGYDSPIPLKVVNTIKFNIIKLQAITYLMTEPQNFSNDYVLMSQDIPSFTINNEITSLTSTQYGGLNTVNKTFPFLLQPSSAITFNVTDNRKSQAVPEQTTRVCLNVVYDLTFWEKNGINPISAIQAMNIQNLKLTFTLTPFLPSVTFSVPTP